MLLPLEINNPVSVNENLTQNSCFITGYVRPNITVNADLQLFCHLSYSVTLF